MLPYMKVVMDGDDGAGNGGGGSGSSSKNDLMVDGDIKKAKPPAGADDCPLVATVSVLSSPPSAVPDEPNGNVSSKRHYRSISIIDARTEEEACASSRVCVSIDPHGMVCGVHTLGGGGGMMSEEGGEENGGGSSMPLTMLGDIVSSAAMACKNLYELLSHDGRRNKKNAATAVEDDGSSYGYLLKNHFLIQ